MVYWIMCGGAEAYRSVIKTRIQAAGNAPEKPGPDNFFDNNAASVNLILSIILL
jgi:hypothetical protein